MQATLALVLAEISMQEGGGFCANMQLFLIVCNTL